MSTQYDRATSTYPDGSLDADSRVNVPSAHSNLAATRGPLPTDSDRDDGLPDVARTEVSWTAPAVDTFQPPAGFQGPDEGAPKYGVGGTQLRDAGLNNVGADINPQGSLVDGSVRDDVARRG